MRYVQLRAFHHVAVAGGFSRAAEELNLTQPAISDQVRKLEEEYDLLLFDRRRKRVALTPVGERLLAITRRMFDTEREAAELLSEARALGSGHLRIVADAPHHLLHLLARFRERYPGVRVSLRTGNSDEVIAQLQTYQADVGVMGEMPREAGIDGATLGVSPIVAFAARGSSLAQRSEVHLSELAGLPLVLREEGSRTRAKLLAAAERAGVALSPAIEAEGREAVREIVAAGGGMGFVSQAEFGADARLVPIPIRPSDGLMMEEALVYLHQRRGAKLIRAFRDIARDEAALEA